MNFCKFLQPEIQIQLFLRRTLRTNDQPKFGSDRLSNQIQCKKTPEYVSVFNIVFGQITSIYRHTKTVKRI